VAYARRQRTWFRKEHADMRVDSPEALDLDALAAAVSDPSPSPAG
jgi:tRNA A37 N6-isopentenylltransferase MiaA